MICSLLTTVGMTPLIMLSLEPPHRCRTGGDPSKKPWYSSGLLLPMPLSMSQPRSRQQSEQIFRVILQQLCEPDPTRRGHPLERKTGGNSFSLERYVARFDFLANRAELTLVKAS